MTVNHPIGEEWIAAHAAGVLPEGAGVLVDTALSYSPESRQTLAAAEAVGGHLLSEAEPAEITPAALEAVMNRIDDMPRQAQATQKPEAALAAHAATSGPAPLAHWRGKGLDEVEWHMLGPGLRRARLWSDESGAQLWLLRGEPGARIPEHSHNGTELVLVLTGTLEDRYGTFGPGDVEERVDDEAHDLRIGEGEPCISLAYTEGRLKMHTLAARLLQPFVGL